MELFYTDLQRADSTLGKFAYKTLLYFEICASLLRVYADVNVHRTLFEDNNDALELATKPRYSPRTKHIAVKFHQFREHVTKGTSSVKLINTREQLADQFTMGLQEGTLRKVM